MGDRANIVVRETKAASRSMADALTGSVVFYTHWSGSDAPAILARALGRKERWDDAPYLARIIFCELVRGQEKEATGFGISAGELCDNEHPILVVSIDEKMVYQYGIGYLSPRDARQLTEPTQGWTFEAFCKVADYFGEEETTD